MANVDLSGQAIHDAHRGGLLPMTPTVRNWVARAILEAGYRRFGNAAWRSGV